VQAFPSVVQVPAAVGTWAQLPPVQMPEQHCVPLVQLAPTVEHAAVAQAPETHASEQHSAAEVQPCPASLQNAAEVHLPDASQTVEQHCEPAVQLSPPTPQAAAGGAVHCSVPLHCPEQHCPGLAAVQVAPTPRHWPGGSTQSPFTHEFVQQFASEAHAWPTALQAAGSTQLPLQAWLQHSDGLEHAVPIAPQVGAGPQVPPALHWPEQHSPAAVQSAPSLLQVCVVWQKPLGHEAEQHSDAAAHAVPSALQDEDL